jgi:hypothetical protein
MLRALRVDPISTSTEDGQSLAESASSAYCICGHGYSQRKTATDLDAVVSISDFVDAPLRCIGSTYFFIKRDLRSSYITGGGLGRPMVKCRERHVECAPERRDAIQPHGNLDT